MSNLTRSRRFCANLRALRLPHVIGCCVVTMMCSAPAAAKELLTGKISGANNASFVLTGESREEIVGGSITVGERTFEITKVSLRGLVGAVRRPSEASADFAVFSSSFSDQTAAGQPWAAGKRYVGCDAPYNSFLAVYTINGAEQIRAIGEIPFKALTDDAANSDESSVYCFTSRPPAK